MLIAIDSGEEEAVCLSQQKYSNPLYGQVLVLTVSYLITQIMRALLCCSGCHGHQHQPCTLMA